MKKLELSKTLNGKSRKEQRQAALNARRQQDSFRRFLESMGGEGFEFTGLNAYARIG